jgi:hypothetical protein
MDKEYRISNTMMAIYGLTSIALFIFSILLFISKNKFNNDFIILIPIFLLFSSFLIFINLIRRKIIINNDYIICVNLFNEKKIDVSQIKGVRIGKSIEIEPLLKDDPTMRIGNYIDFNNSEEIEEWAINNFKDLDAIDLEIEFQKLIHDPKLGDSESSRLKKLNNAKEVSITYNLFGAIFFFLFLFYDIKIITIVIIIYPIIGALINIYSKGLIKFYSNSKRDIYWFTGIGITVISIILLFKSFVLYNILQINNLWLPSILISIILFTLLYYKGLNKSGESVYGQIVFMVLFSVIYGFGSSRTINCEFDNSKEQIFNANIINQRIGYGHFNKPEYYITISKWKQTYEQKEIDVSRDLYYKKRIGEIVEVKYKGGLFQIPWFVIENDKSYNYY